MQFIRLLTIFCIVLPLRNAHYYDALEFLETFQDQIMDDLSQDEAQRHLAYLKERVADRSIAAEINPITNTIGCIKCEETFEAAIAYLLHSCTK